MSRLLSTLLDLRDFVPRDGEVALGRDVIDHQLVDVDGVRVVRASDLYLAPYGGAVRLVGVDVGMHTLLRRLGPARLQATPTPKRVVDWAAIQPLRTPGAPVRLADAHVGLRRLRAAELAGLLEDLGRAQRQGLLDALDPELAAEALEELNDDDRELPLREMPVAQAAGLGVYTGEGLVSLIREQFALRWAAFAVVALLVANLGLVVSEFAGIGAAFELLGVSRYISVPLAALVIWAVAGLGSYR